MTPLNAVAVCKILDDKIQWELDLSLLPDGNALALAIAAADLINHAAKAVEEVGLNGKAFRRDASTIIHRELGKPTAKLTGKIHRVPVS